MKWLLPILLFMSGCVNAGHLIIGRQWLYFDGEAAKHDLWISGEEKKFVKRMGEPDAYKWERWTKEWWSGSIGSLNWGNIWILDLYYVDTVYVFKDHKLYGKRKTWPHEYAHMRGIYPRTPRIVDYSTYPPRVYHMEK